MTAVHQSPRGSMQRTVGGRWCSGRTSGVLVAALSVALCWGATLGAQPRPRGDNDLQVGDRVVLRVEGEAQLTDTFTVGRGPALVLPIIGNVSLAGVRRDSVERVLSEAVARFYRNPAVHARVLVRVAVIGEVARPGFYSVPTDALVPDVVMAAGGPTATAQIDHIRLTRLGAELMSPDSVQRVIALGRTLSQIEIRSEDQFSVPRVAEADHTIRTISLWLTIPMAIATLLYFASHR